MLMQANNIYLNVNTRCPHFSRLDREEEANYNIYYLVGGTDGVYKGKRYFKCPMSHGIIVPIYQVHVLVPRDV